MLSTWLLLRDPTCIGLTDVCSGGPFRSNPLHEQQSLFLANAKDMDPQDRLLQGSQYDSMYRPRSILNMALLSLTLAVGHMRSFERHYVHGTALRNTPLSQNLLGRGSWIARCNRPFQSWPSFFATSQNGVGVSNPYDVGIWFWVFSKSNASNGSTKGSYCSDAHKCNPPLIETHI